MNHNLAKMGIPFMGLRPSIRRVVPVVLVNPKTKIDRKNLRSGEYIIKSDNFSRWIAVQTERLNSFEVVSIVARFAAFGMDEQTLRDLGNAICAADCPASFDWEMRLGVAAGVAAPPSAPEVGMASSNLAAALSEDIAAAIPERIATPHGDITIQRIGAEYAIRNPPHADIIAVVKTVCRGNGRWNGRYINWLIPADNIGLVTNELAQHFHKP